MRCALTAAGADEGKFLEQDSEGQFALLLRPIPSTMAKAGDAVRFGGLPRLPDDMEWPCQDNGLPTHFLAEIDLARLPSSHDGHQAVKIPRKGTLFVFAPMGEDGFHGDQKAQVLYTAKSVKRLAERDPPQGLPNLLDHGAMYMDEDGTTHAGRVLVRRHLDVLPFLSPQRLPFWHEMDGDFRGVEVDQDAIDTKADTAIREHETRLAAAFREARPLVGAKKPHAQLGTPKAIPKVFRERVATDETPSARAPIAWSFVYDWARFFYLNCLRLARAELFRALQDAQTANADPTPWLDRLIKNDGAFSVVDRIERSRDASLQNRPDAEPRSVTAPFDDQALRWLAIASEAKGELSPAQRTVFVEMLSDLSKRGREKDSDFNTHWVIKTFGEQDLEEEEEPTRLYPSGIRHLDELVPDTRIHLGMTLLAALDAYEFAGRLEQARDGAAVEASDDPRAQVARWDQRLLHADAKSAGSPDRFSAMFPGEPLQMFGQAKGTQNQAADYDISDRVLLMQIGDAEGLPLKLSGDVVMHLWIAPDDLAKGRFDTVETTVSMS